MPRSLRKPDVEGLVTLSDGNALTVEAASVRDWNESSLEKMQNRQEFPMAVPNPPYKEKRNRFPVLPFLPITALILYWVRISRISAKPEQQKCHLFQEEANLPRAIFDANN